MPLGKTRIFLFSHQLQVKQYGRINFLYLDINQKEKRKENNYAIFSNKSWQLTDNMQKENVERCDCLSTEKR